MSDNATINQKVLIWARGKKGQQVGAGECWDLADRALRHAGAQSSTTTGKNDDYIGASRWRSKTFSRVTSSSFAISA